MRLLANCSDAVERRGILREISFRDATDFRSEQPNEKNSAERPRRFVEHIVGREEASLAAETYVADDEVALVRCPNGD